MAQQAIELRNVCKKRKAQTIGPLNLDIPAGYVTALVGQNGSGKSTLLHMLLQLAFPEEGEIRWFEQRYPDLLPLEVRQQIAYVAEHPLAEENWWTAEEAARFRSGWYPNWDGDYFEALMEEFEVPRDQRLSKMSKGQRRKFEIAAALAPHPRLLLLDEPSSGLDPFAWKAMIARLQEHMEREGTTIIISSHIIEEVRRLADYIVLMHRGQLLGMAEKDSLFGTWTEIWVNAESAEELEELRSEFPDAQRVAMESADTASLLIQDFHKKEKRLQDLGVKVIKSRSLELDEILSLWTKGHGPILMDQKRGD
ncbi:ATP-binding cassette domain-containing protein [Paenibacillus sp. NFR01]|uniref:ATP-binding cassette domain-containing protein n=1 Tax=Paenibacillus sp. NFR01 TaxID=1566279 RepID=UPI0008B94C84|nr:ABC transporter ATP-binding protein [Paenibacillus sp. NFR01]SEU29673.1 ABC-2 type transport system ATP-binding protein [Paenibacillus sp. NFR01]